jgi:hypothetical protein
MSNELVEKYAELIQPLLEDAKKAYGSRSQSSPAHQASREYTRLLIEFRGMGGSLPLLAKRLNVAYAGVRRRVVMNGINVSNIKPSQRIRGEAVKQAAARVRAAKERGTDNYHDQLAEEYKSGISLSNLSKELGLSSAAPLYYGVQRSLQRTNR